jgi:hypothetical protein
MSAEQASAAFKAGLDAYSRGAKADIIDDMIDRAGVDARTWNQSGSENAIRSEFRRLYKNKAKIRLFTPEERAAIRGVATGGSLGLIARYIGKFAPRGVVSAGMGTVIGAPLGPFGPPIVWAAGEAGRRASDAIIRRRVDRTSELIRSGGATAAPPKTGPSQSPLALRAALARALLLQAGSQQ